MTDRAIAHANGAAPAATICFNQTCPRPGTHFPVLMMGPHDRIPGETMPYRLEVPRAVCLECQRHFQPLTFLTDESRAKIEVFLTKNERPLPDYDRLYIVWKSLAGPEWPEVKAAGEARLWI